MSSSRKPPDLVVVLKLIIYQDWVTRFLFFQKVVKCCLNIENNQNEQQKIVEMLDNVKKMLLDKEFELKNMQDSINNGVQYAKYQQKIVTEEKQQVADESECLKYFSKHIFGVLLLPLYKMALREIKDAGKIDMGIPHIHSKTIEFLLNRGKCICGSDLHQNVECVKNLQTLMYTLPPHSLGNMIGSFLKEIKNKRLLA